MELPCVFLLGQQRQNTLYFLCVFEMPVMVVLESVDSPCHCKVWGVIGDVCPDWSILGVTMRDVSGKFAAASLMS